LNAVVIMSRLSQSGPKGVEQPKRKQKKHAEAEKSPERDEGMDKTLADSFPASDPPSTIPDPEDTENENAA
jgi:hypothetical protein